MTDELYDLESDPFEITNIVGDPGFAGVKRDLQSELRRLVLDAMGLSAER